jgi:hypothetical protein
LFDTLNYLVDDFLIGSESDILLEVVEMVFATFRIVQGAIFWRWPGDRTVFQLEYSGQRAKLVAYSGLEDE